MPKDDAGRPRIIDWQSYESGLAAYDLAYMIALHWFPDRRRVLERGLLELYLDALARNGVRYPFDDFMEDYRISVIQLLFLPAFQWDVELSPEIWFNHLERIFWAYDDLGCDDVVP